MEAAMKLAVIDDRYWSECRDSSCFRCIHLKSCFDQTCTAYPEELPPEYWNGEKPCPKREEKPDSLPQKN